MKDFFESKNALFDYNFILHESGELFAANSNHSYPVNPVTLYSEGANRIISGRPAPITLTLDPSNICNEECVFCRVWEDVSSESDKSWIRIEHLKTVLTDMARNGLLHVFICGTGDCFSYLHARELIKHLSSLNLKPTIITNGTGIKDDDIPFIAEHTSLIRFSVDSARAETHKLLHQKDTFDKKMRTARLLAEYRNAHNLEFPYIGGHFIVMPQNWKEIPDFARMFKDLGADFVDFVWVLPVADFEHTYKDLPHKEIQKLLEGVHELETETFHINSHLKNKLLPHESFHHNAYLKKEPKNCYDMVLRPYLFHDSNLIGCAQENYHKDRKTIINDIKTARDGEFRGHYDSYLHKRETEDLSSLPCESCPMWSFNSLLDWVLEHVRTKPESKFYRVLIKDRAIIKNFDAPLKETEHLNLRLPEALSGKDSYINEVYIVKAEARMGG